jgi:hypothetical protein
MYRVTHPGDPQGTEYKTATQAIRGMAGAVLALPLTDAEQRAFKRWYTQRAYRSVSQQLRVRGSRYEMHVQVNGERLLFVIEPPPPLPFQHTQPTPVVRVCVPPQGNAGDGSEAHGGPPPCTA